MYSRFADRRQGPILFGLAATVFVLSFVAHWPGVAGGVLWDDPAHLTRPDLRSWAGLWRIFTEIGATQEFYPILHGAFWLEHRLWGDYLPAYHVLNIVLHAASACLLGGLLWRLRPALVQGGLREERPYVGAAFLAALLFALHPVTVESVAWMTEQKNTLSIFFSLLALHAHLAFVETRRVGAYAAGLVLFLIALGAKTATVVVAPAMLVLLWWRNGRLDWKRDVVPLVPWFILAVIAGLVTIQVETHLVGAKGDEFALTLVERTMLSSRIAWFYIGKLVWPQELIFFYPRWNVSQEAPGWWPYLVATLLVTVVGFMWRQRFRGPLATWLLFLGVMFPVIGFLNVFAYVFAFVADHFQYMPCAVFCAAVAGTVRSAAMRLPGRLADTVWVAGVIGCLVLGGLTFRQSGLYLSNESLFRDVITRNPESWMAHQILAVQFAKEGRPAESMHHYREVMRLKPSHPDAYLGLALELQKVGTGTRVEVLELLQKSIELRPHFFEAQYNLGVALARDPRQAEAALGHLRLAAELRPYSWEARHAYGMELLKKPATLNEGLGHVEEALRLNPQRGSLHRDYADGLARAGRLQEAVAKYQAALSLDANDSATHSHLADVLLMGLQRPDEAERHYRDALVLDPEQAEVRIRLASILAQKPNGMAEATQHVENAVRLAPRNPSVRNTLGILAAQQGDLERAEQEWTIALEIDPTFEDARLNLQRLRELAP